MLHNTKPNTSLNGTPRHRIRQARKLEKEEKRRCIKPYLHSLVSLAVVGHPLLEVLLVDVIRRRLLKLHHVPAQHLVFDDGCVGSGERSSDRTVKNREIFKTKKPSPHKICKSHVKLSILIYAKPNKTLLFIGPGKYRRVLDNAKNTNKNTTNPIE